LTTPIIFSEVYKLWSSLLCSLLQPSTASLLTGPSGDYRDCDDDDDDDDDNNNNNNDNYVEQYTSL
jgi:hypothetical protein